MPSWESPSAEVLEKAASEKRPLLIFFPGEGDQYGDAYLTGEDVKKLSEESAVFIRVAYTSDLEQAPWATDSAVPTSKLLSDNPTRDYGVRSYPTFIVADSYGNEVLSIKKKPSAAELTNSFAKVESKMEKEVKSLAKNLKSAQEAMKTDDRSKALKAILKNFKDGIVGYEEQEETIRLYHEILDAARGEVSELADAGGSDSVAALKKLKKEFKGTDLVTEIDEAIKKLS